MKKASLMLCILASSMSYAANNPVSLSVAQDIQNLTSLYVQANENSVEVRDVIVNRGNCEVRMSGARPVRPITLQFGGEQKYWTSNFKCTVKEVQIVTNYGTFTFNTK